MNFEELGNSWRQQNDKAHELDPTEVLVNVVRKAERGRITNMLMGVVGFVVSLLVVRDFGNMILYDSNTLVRIGAALCVLGALGLIVSIVFSFWPSRISGQSICGYLSRELQRTNKVIASNKSPYTYIQLALLTTGACVIAASNLPTPRMILTIALALGIVMIVVWAARRTISRAETLRQDMEQLLSDLRQDQA